MIFIARHHQQLGQFTDEEVARGLREGRFLPTDLAWKEGMEQWRPLSEFPLPEPPPKSDALGDTPSSAEAAPQAKERPGLPWENEGGLLARWWETTCHVLFSPTQTFRAMKVGGGFGQPVFYLLLCLVLSFTANIVWQIIFDSMMAALGLAGENPIPGLLAKSAMTSIATLVCGPPLALGFVVFVYAPIQHVSLMIFGGAKEGLETTCRCVCYISGASAIVQIIPILGPLAMVVWSPILQIISLKEAHRTELWRSACAVALPYVVCCVSAAAIVVLMTGALAAAVQQTIGG